MRKTTAFVLVLSVVLALAWGFQVTQAQSTGAAIPKIATVNIAKVMMECQEYLDRDKQLSERTNQIQSELDKLNRDATAIRQELENALQPGTKEYNDQLMKWFEKNAMAEAYKEGNTKLLTSESELWAEMLYKKVAGEVARVARQQGVDLVLNQDSGDIKARNLSELQLQIRTRVVVYGTPSLDLTALVLENLDRTYETNRNNP